jgi:hypothetical protein
LGQQKRRHCEEGRAIFEKTKRGWLLWSQSVKLKRYLYPSRVVFEERREEENMVVFLKDFLEEERRTT